MGKALHLLLIYNLAIISLNGQNKINTIGSGISYLVPTGSLGSRFLPATGINIFYGQKSTKDWEWFGKFEYINFNEENRDRLKIKRDVNLGGNNVVKIFDLPKLVTDLKIFGISANGISDLFDFGFVRGCISFGFGIYRWESFRGEYFDTLRVDTDGVTYDAVILKVPALKQLDWSGGFNLGLILSKKIFDPIFIEVGANYKAIMGELWATLDLDLENVSVFQMYELRFAIKADF